MHCIFKSGRRTPRRVPEALPRVASALWFEQDFSAPTFLHIPALSPKRQDAVFGGPLRDVGDGLARAGIHDGYAATGRVEIRVHASSAFVEGVGP